MTLLRKELWRVLKSPVYLLMAIAIVAFAWLQGVFPPDSSIGKPMPGGSYGMKASGDPALIMPEAAAVLFAQYSANEYTTYPNGFMKRVKLNQADCKTMGKIVAELSKDEISQAKSDAPDNGTHQIQIGGDGLQPDSDGSFQMTVPEDKAPSMPGFELNRGITWKRFTELMAQADDLLGGGSDFSETWINHRFGQIPVTYEEALAEYERTVSHDKLTGAHARLFSDYMGIILGLLPVFPAVFLCLRDRKNIASMLYTRRVSSARFILTRYLALLAATMLPVLLMCAILTGIHAANYGVKSIDMLAYFKYALFWQLPTAMSSIALGLFLTTLTASPIAIAAQLIWWVTDILGASGSYSFFGVRPLQLVPRHNSLGKTGLYLEYLPTLVQNRIYITCIAIVLVFLTIWVFNAKRRGMLHAPAFQYFKRNEIQPAV